MALNALLLCACQSPSYPPLQRAAAVDVARYMGDWYVIACIPSFIERHEFQAVESYRQDPQGRIRTIFRYRDGGFDRPLHALHPVGFVVPGTHGTVWGMRFIWPIRADYRIMYIDSQYTQTVVGREKRDYAWIMARTPTLPDADFQRLSALLRAQGYDTSRLRKVPQLPAPEPR